MLFQDDDDHYCLKCGRTISGIEAYVAHRKQDCGQQKGDVKKTSEENISEFPEAGEETPTDQFFSTLQLQRRKEVIANDKATPGVVTRSQIKSKELKQPKTYGGANKNKTVLPKKEKKAEKKKHEAESIEGIAEKDVWLSFGREDRNATLKMTAELNYAMSPSYMVDLPEVRDPEVDKFLQDVNYEDTYDTLIDMDDIHYDPSRSEQKGKSGSSPMLWLGQSGWDYLDSDEPELLKSKKNVPPPTFTGGKWKPVSMLPPESGGKWRSFASSDSKCKSPSFNCMESHVGGKLGSRQEFVGKLQNSSFTDSRCKSPSLHPPEGYTGGKFAPRLGGKSPLHGESSSGASESPWPRAESHPGPSHTSGKWMPHDSLAPPVNHTKGKWLPSPQATGKFLKTSGGSIEYFCSTCRRRLASKEMYKRHILSELHLKRMLYESDLEYDVRSLKRSRQDRDIAEGKRRVKVPVKYESSQGTGNARNQNRAKKSKKSKKRIVWCAACKTKVGRGKMGKHLVSYHHYRRSNLDDPLHREQVLNHMHAITRQSPYQCSPCHFYCNTAVQFRAHWHGPEHQDDSPKENYFWCSFCKFHCQTADEVRRHLDGQDHNEVIRAINGSMPIIIRSPEIIACHLCNKDFRLRIRLRIHMARYHGESRGEELLQCSICDFTTLSRKGLQVHGARAHGKALSDYFCEVCTVSFVTKETAADHRKTREHRYAMIEKKIMSGRVDPASYKRKCSLCPKVVDTPLALAKHVDDAHPSKHVCLRCGMKFANSQLLSRHSASTSGCQFPTSAQKSDAKWTCRKCRFGTDSKADMLFHEIFHNANDNDKYLACPECKKVFLRKRLRVHLQLHTFELPYACATCQKRFPYPSSLALHKCNNRENGRPRKKAAQKVTVCVVCGYKGKTVTLYNRHMLTHEDKREYSCPHCPFKAKLSDHIKRHLRLHTGAKPFKCPHCEYTCNLLENLRKHVLNTSVHPGRKMYECQWCPFGSNTARDFDNHVGCEHTEHYDAAKKSHLWNIYNPQNDALVTETPLRAKLSERRLRKEAAKKKEHKFTKPSILRKYCSPKILPAKSSGQPENESQDSKNLLEAEQAIISAQPVDLYETVLTLQPGKEEGEIKKNNENVSMEVDPDDVTVTEVYVIEDGEVYIMNS